MDIKRVNTIKVGISDISSGKYVKQEGFNPNYVISKEGYRVSRARLIADVVDRFISDNKTFAALTLDDGKDTISAKCFQDITLVEKTEVGTTVDIIGKVREYQGEIYIIPEVIYTIKEPNMVILRALEVSKIKEIWNKNKELVNKMKKECSDIIELKKIMKDKHNISEENVESLLYEEKEEGTVNNKENILKIIEENDSGEGCDYSILMEKSNMTENMVDSIINELLEEGTCFEPKPGKIKKL